MFRQGFEGLWACEGSDELCKELKRCSTYAQDVGEKSTATRTELDDPHALGSALRGPLRDIPDSEELEVVIGSVYWYMPNRSSSAPLQRSARSRGW